MAVSGYLELGAETSAWCGSIKVRTRLRPVTRSSMSRPPTRKSRLMMNDPTYTSSARPPDQAVRHATSAIPDGLLPAFSERPYRRSEGRLEGQGALGRLCQLRGLA